VSEPAQAAGSTANRLTPELRDYLAAVRWATIATVDADGAPHQAVVWYGIDHDVILINSRRERHWPRNLRRDPRITVAVQDWSDPEHWVGLKGQARVVHKGAAAIADIQAIARRYGGDPKRFEGQDRLTFRVEIEQTFEYRGG
jgi:PPOX class probable F420-dependent enzyme